MDAVVILTVHRYRSPPGSRRAPQIESDDEDGNETAHVDIEAFRLTPGLYDLSLSLYTPPLNVDLGQFCESGSAGMGMMGARVKIITKEDNQDRDGHEERSGWISVQLGRVHQNWGSGKCGRTGTNTEFYVRWLVWGQWFGNLGGDGGSTASARNNQTEIETDLPADVNPTDIAEIIVSDSNGNLILVGDLVTPSAGTVVNISGTVQVVPGPGAPGIERHGARPKHGEQRKNGSITLRSSPMAPLRKRLLK